MHLIKYEAVDFPVLTTDPHALKHGTYDCYCQRNLARTSDSVW